jgi:transcriptional regulator with XRE-family HTH domain
MARGLSQKSLGIEIGLDPGVASTRLNRYEQAVHFPDFPTLERLAKALGVPLAYLFSEDDALAEMILKFDPLSQKANIGN